MYARLATELAAPEWASRLWTDVETGLGMAALFALMAWGADARAGVAAAVVFVTSRLYHAEPRTLSMLGGGSFVVVSAASIAVAWLASRRKPVGHLAALAAALTLGALALALSTLDLGAPAWGLCAPSGAAATPPTFDRVLAELGHGFFPWSALLPFALASLIEPPRLAREPEYALRVLLLTGATLATALGALSHHCQDPAPFAGAVFVAGAVGLWIRDLSRGARVSGAVLVCVGLVVALLALDFVRIPAKRGIAFGWGSNAGPLSDRVLEHPNAATLFIASAALALTGALVAWLAGSVEQVAAWRRHLQGPALFAGALLGALLVQFGYYRSLRARLSPRTAFQTYEDRAGLADTLALLGVNERDAKHARAQPSLVTSDTRAALAWLTSANPAARRFIALGGEQLPRLNAEYRALHPRRNLPVIDARSNLTLLAVDRLAPGEQSDNPLNQLLIEALPADLQRVDAELGERVRISGWQLLADDGSPIASVPAGTPFELRVYYELLEANVERHCTFLHIDHRPTRFTAEHTEWQEYPLSLWRRGDLIVDTYKVDLPLHFGPGRYSVYFGFGVLPCRDDRRLPVTRGADDHGRVRAGTLTVR